MTSPHHREAGERLQRVYPHLNLRWSLADIWRIEELARKGSPADHIAFVMDTTSVEIERVCQRNGFWLKRRSA